MAAHRVHQLLTSPPNGPSLLRLALLPHAVHQVLCSQMVPIKCRHAAGHSCAQHRHLEGLAAPCETLLHPGNISTSTARLYQHHHALPRSRYIAVFQDLPHSPMVPFLRSWARRPPLYLCLLPLTKLPCLRLVGNHPDNFLAEVGVHRLRKWRSAWFVAVGYLSVRQSVFQEGLCKKDGHRFLRWDSSAHGCQRPRREEGDKPPHHSRHQSIHGFACSKTSLLWSGDASVASATKHWPAGQPPFGLPVPCYN